MPKLYMLIGIPASGKSTWVYNQEWAKDCILVSTDRYVQLYARWCGKTYTEIFEEYMPKAVELMTQEILYAKGLGVDIIWDQTSTTIASRAKKFRMLSEYYTIGVVFPIPEREELDRRLSTRPGKIVPPDVIDNMINGWEEPEMEEGFNEIWRI